MTDQPERSPLAWCFSTLGCADLSFSEICQVAGEFGVPGIELRAVGGRLDLPAYFAEEELLPGSVQESCQRHRAQLVVAGSSIKLVSASDTDRTELLAFGAWAETLHIPYVRVFGGGTWGTPLSNADYAHAVQFVNDWRKEKDARGWQVELLLETHDAFSGSEPCLKLNKLLTSPLHLIWDSHHTWRLGGESPSESWAKIGPWVRHVHLKDSMDKASARHPFTYVLPGDGQMPLEELVDLLRNECFAGFVSLEWERLWHPYLPPLRDALLRLREQPWFAEAGQCAKQC